MPNIEPVKTAVFMIVMLLSGSTIASLFPGWIGILIALIMLPWSLYIILFTIIHVQIDIFKGRLRLAARRAICAVTTAFLFLPCLRAGDCIHLILALPYYIVELDIAHKTTPVRIDWGDAALFVTNGLQARMLVYDPSDQMEAFVGERRAGQVGGVFTQHLLGHFYLEDECSGC